MPVRPRVRPPVLAVPLLALLALLFVVPPAAAEPVPGPESASGPASDETWMTTAEYYADLLAREPEGAAVFVDDALAGRYDLEELEAELHSSFGALGVPYHVIASPFPGTGPEWGPDLLPALRDRMGADGLYVHLRPEGSRSEVVSQGVDLPVDLAVEATAGDPRLEYDSPIDEVAAVLTEALVDPGLGTRVDEARAEAEDYSEPTAWEEFLDALDPTSSTGPENLGLLAGAATGTVLGLGVILFFAARPQSTSGKRWIRPLHTTWILVPAVCLTTVAVLGSLAYMDSVPPGGAEIPDPATEARAAPPYVSSTVRAERLTGELEDSPLHVDPRVPMPLEGLDEVAEHLAEAPVPTRALVLPMHEDDPARANPEVLARALASVSGVDAVYLVVTPGFDGAEITAVPVGVGLDHYELWGDTGLGDSAEATPAEVLDHALRSMVDVEADFGAEEEPPVFDDYVYVPEPRLGRYFSDGFLPGLLFVGPLLALVLALLGMVAGAVALVVRRRGSGSGNGKIGTRALRRMARTESARVTSLLASDRAERIPRKLMPQAEAVLMVMDHDPDDLDLLGTVVVSRRVLAAVGKPSTDSYRSPCMINPLHGLSVTSHRSRVAKGAVPMCGECSGLSDQRRAKRVLRVRDRTGGELRYLSLDDRAWVWHRFGAHLPVRMVESLLEEIDAR